MNIISFTKTSGTNNASIRKSTDDGVSFGSTVNATASSGISFASIVTNDLNVLLIGSYTEIVRSADGGSTWSSVASLEATSDCYGACISPTDENKMWMAGRYARVHYSSDKGLTWSKIWQAPSAASTNYIYAIQMISDTVGWMCGYVYSVDGIKNSVWKTTDGGVNWTIQKNNFSYAPYGLYALDANTIYLSESNASGHIWKSTNGGTNWADLGIAGRTLEGGKIFAMGNRVWATGRNTSTIEVLYSNNGGTDWNRVSWAEAVATAESRVPIVFVTESIGYLGSYRLYKSTDGGQTWTQRGICAGSAGYLCNGLGLTTTLVTEFRTFDITGVAPTNRTTEGSAIAVSNPLNFGSVGAGNNSPVKCLIWRASNLGIFTIISDMRAWLESKNLVGTNFYYMDITNTWTQNKTPAQVAAGTPGTCPQSLPGVANLTKIGGGDITGVGHADTSQYIYVCFAVGGDEVSGVDIALNYRVNADKA